MEVSPCNPLKFEHQALLSYNTILKKTKAKVEKAIKKYKRYKENKQTADILIELERALDEVNDNIEESEERLLELEYEIEYSSSEELEKVRSTINFLSGKEAYLDAIRRGDLFGDIETVQETTTEETITEETPKEPSPTVSGDNTFTPVNDKTNGKGFTNIEDASPGAIQGFKLAFEQDVEVFNSGVNKIFLEYFSNGNPIPLDIFALPLEIVLHYHPELLNDPRVQKRFNEYDEKGANREEFFNEAKSLIERFEGRDKKTEAERISESNARQMTDNYISKVDKALADNPKSQNRELIKEGKELLEEIKTRIKKFNRSVIKPILEDFANTINSKLKEYSDKVALNKKTVKNPTVGNDIIDTLNTNEEIKAVLRNLINERKTAITEGEVANITKQIKELGSAWNSAISEDDVFKVGNEVIWETGGTKRSGTIKQLIKTKDSGANALILTPNNKLSLVNTMALSKHGKAVKELNSENHKNWKIRIDAETGEAILDHKGEYSAVRVNSSTKGKFRNYLEETRDKTNDKFVFQFILPRKGRPEEYDSIDQKTVMIYEKIRRGDKVTPEELTFFGENIEISIKLDKPGHPTNAVAGDILNKRKAGENWSIEKEFRDVLLSRWMQAGMKMEGTQNNILKGVYANPHSQAPGTLNDTGANNKVTDIAQFSEVPLSKIQLYTPQITTDNVTVVYDREGTKRIDLPLHIKNYPGMVFIEAKTNRGEFFPLALQKTMLKDYNEGKQLKMIGQILQEMAKVEFDFKGNAGALANIDPSFASYLPTNFTYQQIWDTIVYPGKDGSQLTVRVNTSAKEIRIGDTTWKFDKLAEEEVRNTILKTIGLKFMNINFTGNGVKVKDNKYLGYLFDTKALTTNIPSGEPIFKTIDNNKGGQVGLELYFKPENIKITTEKAFTKKVDTKTVVEKVKLTAAARKMLIDSRVYKRAELKTIPWNVIPTINTIANNIKTTPNDVLIYELRDIKENTKKCK